MNTSIQALECGVYANFHEAAQNMLRFLRQRFGFGSWLITRTEGDDWIMLEVEDQIYGVQRGDVLRWSDSYCSQMVLGLGPAIAPDAAAIAAYSTAPINAQLAIGTYIGLPLTMPDGRLFGTLCAIDPAPQDEHITHELPLLEIVGRLLVTLLHNELELQRTIRALEHSNVEAHTDQLTGIYNRRGWDRLIELEEERCRRYGHPAGVIMLDLDDLKTVNDRHGHQAGDYLIKQASQVIRDSLRGSDIVSRLGGDEFAVLAVEARSAGVRELAQRLLVALQQANIAVSVGWAVRDPRSTLIETLQRADERMYRHKQRHKP